MATRNTKTTLKKTKIFARRAKALALLRGQALAAATDTAVTCAGYDIQSLKSDDSFNIVEVVVLGDDGVKYHLRVRKSNDRTELVQAFLHKIATLWPAYDFKFKANPQDKEITDIL